MDLHLKIIGIVFILLAFLHLGFPRRFRWKGELSLVSDINKEMMYIHTLFIALMILLMGLLCLTSSVELTTTTFGKKISLGLGIFWGTRLFIQFFGYSSSLWRGKTFETIVHIMFAGLWLYVSGVFLKIYFG